MPLDGGDSRAEAAHGTENRVSGAVTVSGTQRKQWNVSGAGPAHAADTIQSSYLSV